MEHERKVGYSLSFTIDYIDYVALGFLKHLAETKYVSYVVSGINFMVCSITVEFISIKVANCCNVTCQQAQVGEACHNHPNALFHSMAPLLSQTTKCPKGTTGSNSPFTSFWNSRSTIKMICINDSMLQRWNASQPCLEPTKSKGSSLYPYPLLRCHTWQCALVQRHVRKGNPQTQCVLYVLDNIKCMFHASLGFPHYILRE